MSGEFDVIKKYLRPLADNDLALNLEDDVALLPKSLDGEIICSSDVIASDVHFFKNDSPALIAKKLLRVNISDIAAKSVRPNAYMLNLSLPSFVDEAWIADFCKGLAEDQELYDISLLGGDIVATKNDLVLGATIFGEADSGAFVKRSGANIGDIIFVTGAIGDAYLGLKILLGEFTSEIADKSFINRYHLPRPRVALADRLKDFASSASDVSDGLLADLQNILVASKKAASVDLDKVPISAMAEIHVAENPALFNEMIVAGDDYEIIFTADPRFSDEIILLAEKLNLPISAIGTISEGEGLSFSGKKSESFDVTKFGFEHKY
mgnify:CR=1 FL=1|jgi:thiamine-monophosphate kinase